MTCSRLKLLNHPALAENKPHLQGVLQSITHYIANDSLAPDQRFGFLVLNKFLTLWVTPYRAPTAPALANGAPPSPVPGFEQFLYTNAVKLCFEVPLKADFDYSDAQSYQVSILLSLGPLVTPDLRSAGRLSARLQTF